MLVFFKVLLCSCVHIWKFLLHFAFAVVIFHRRAKTRVTAQQTDPLVGEGREASQGDETADYAGCLGCLPTLLVDPPPCLFWNRAVMIAFDGRKEGTRAPSARTQSVATIYEVLNMRLHPLEWKLCKYFGFFMGFMVRATTKVMSRPRFRGVTCWVRDSNLGPPECSSRAFPLSYISAPYTLCTLVYLK